MNTPGKPTINNFIINPLSKLMILENLLVAPIPNATVAILWTVSALIKEILNNNNIAGNWITPAPPPENAEKIFEIRDIMNKQICSNKL